MTQQFNICSIHQTVEIFPHIWVRDREQVYLSSYAVKEAACPACERAVKQSFDALWGKRYPPSRTHSLIGAFPKAPFLFSPLIPYPKYLQWIV